MSSAEFNIEPGMTLSHFRIEKLLGEGGMGAVYLAEDITLSREVAIKFMNRSMLATLGTKEMKEQIEQRFIREAKSVARINHPNIAQVHEANFSSDNWYIVMEYIRGKPLDELLKERGFFSEAEALDILEQSVRGLKYAWEKCSIVHRDIKPGNLMLTSDNYVKIVDLGLAKPVQEEDDLDLTGAGVPVGTPFYMSPEQAVAGKVDYRADMFALGATVFELLTGKKAYMGKTPVMIYRKKVNQEYEKLETLSINSNISRLIDCLLEPEAVDRYDDYDKLLKDISVIKSGRGVFSKAASPINIANEMSATDEVRTPHSFDPMMETLDESAYQKASDPMMETLDESSGAAYNDDSMAVTMDFSGEQSVLDPMLETLDESTYQKISEEKNKTPQESSYQTSSDPMIQTLDESILAKDKLENEPNRHQAPSEDQQSSVTEQQQDQPQKKKNYLIWLAVTAAVLFVGLNFFSPLSLLQPQWPEVKWQTFVNGYQAWHTEYKNTTALESYGAKDKKLVAFINLMNSYEIAYFNQLLKSNKDNSTFVNAPYKVVPNLLNRDNIQKLSKALEQQRQVQEAFRALEIHHFLKEQHNKLTEFQPSVAKFIFNNEPGAAELLKAYKAFEQAGNWLNYLGDIREILNSIVAKVSEEDKAELAVLKSSYNSWVLKQDFYGPLSHYQDRKKLEEFLQKVSAAGSVEKENVVDIPMQEVKAMLADLKKSGDREDYRELIQKIDELKKLIEVAQPDAKAQFASLEKQAEELKPEDIPLEAIVAAKAERRKGFWPKVEIHPNQDCYYILVKHIRDDEVKVIEPLALKKGSRISGNVTSATKEEERILRRQKEVKIEVICFTYFSDLSGLFKWAEGNAESSLFLLIKTQKMEEYLKKVKSENVFRKVLDLKN